MSSVEKKEGATQSCKSCGETIICRLNDYGGKYEAKLQWQEHDSNKAHYDKTGTCKHAVDSEKPKTESEPKMVAAVKPEETKTNNAEPTPDEYLAKAKLLLANNPALQIDNLETFIQNTVNSTQAKIGKYLIKRSVIEKTMNELGVQHPSRMRFIEDVLK